jgi:signal transduction histidine kinase
MFCTDILPPIALIFSGSTPALLYYSHLPVIFTALLFGLLVYSKNKSLESKLLLALVSVFALWNLIDLVNWTNVDSRIIMVSWSFMNLVFLLIPALALYFSYVFLKKQQPPLTYFLLGISPPCIFAALLPTSLNLTGFDLAICEAVEGPLTHYFHLLQAFYFVWLMLFLVRECYINWRKKNKQAVLLSLGVGFFVFSFYTGNLVAIVLDNWELEQYGLFGMLVFLVFLVMLIVKYQAFNMKMLSAQAFVGALVVLIGAEFFFVSSTISIVLTSITFVLSIVLGIFLIREVKKEVERKEELEVLTSELSAANAELKRLDTAKSEFISIASHQLRTPLTAIRGFLSLLIEGAYGKLEPKVAETLDKLTIANNRLMGLVENLLNISRIEAGRIQYQFAPTRIETIVDELDDMFTLAAKAKGLNFTVVKPTQSLPLLSLDAAKIREVLSNLIDNAMKYTPKGSVTISFEDHGDCVAVVITDTGMGIDPQDLPHLFKKFERGSQAERVNVSSTGLGLYVGRKFAEAHGGSVTAYSDGKDKGSRFVLELPVHVAETVKRLPQA